MVHVEPQAIPDSIPNFHSQDLSSSTSHSTTAHVTPASSAGQPKDNHSPKKQSKFSGLWGIILKWFRERKKILELWFACQRLVKWFNKTFDRWQANVGAAIFAAISVLIANSGIFILASTKHSSESVGLWTIFQGDCKQANNLSLAAHAMISIMSTVSDHEKVVGLS